MLKSIDLFAGIGGIRLGFENAFGNELKTVFVSEWGASRADGSGGVFTQESETWLNFLHQNGISWANWSLCDKNETSAALKPGTPTNRPWTDNDLTPSGKFVFSHF